MTGPDRDDLVAALNELLERARSTVSVIQVCLRATADEEVRGGLKEAIVSQARVCSTVYRHIQGLGAEPTTRMSPVGDDLHARTELGPQMEAVAGVLEDFIGLAEGHLALMDGFSRDFFAEALPEQRQHLEWARKAAQRHAL